MKVIKKLKRKKGKEYLLNPLGEIYEVSTSMKLIGKITKKKGKAYSLVKDKIIEKDVVNLTPKEFFDYKKSGKLAELFREGKEVEISEDESMPISELDNLNNSFIRESLKDRTIVEANISNESGNRIIQLILDNGKIVTLKEGLFSGSNVLEIE